jgi:uncharacterized protein (DUF1786 family)
MCSGQTRILVIEDVGVSMLSLADLSQQVYAYENGRISLDDFEDWFRDNSHGAYQDESLSDICASIEAAFSKYYFQRGGETQMRHEMVSAINKATILAPVGTDRAL